MKIQYFMVGISTSPIVELRTVEPTAATIASDCIMHHGPLYHAAALRPFVSVLMSAVPAPTPPAIAGILSERRLTASDYLFVKTPADLPTNTAAEAAEAIGLGSPSQVVKSLVFVALNGVPLLVLVDGDSRVHLQSLERHMGCRVRMATPAEALAATGHRVGTIPPICVNAVDTLRVFMDSAILAAPTPVVYAGGGEDGLHLQISPQLLARASSATVGDFALASPTSVQPEVEVDVSRPSSVPTPPLLSPPSPSPPLPSVATVATAVGEVQVVAADEATTYGKVNGATASTPLADLEPAPTEDARGEDQRPGGPNAKPLKEEVLRILNARAIADGPVALPRARVLRVRRQARQLLFASLQLLDAPTHYEDEEPAGGAADARPVAPRDASPPSMRVGSSS